MKSDVDYFKDWESYVFGFGYGTGEEHVIPALKRFLGAVPTDTNYDYHTLEAACGPTVAWLLINTLCGCDIIEYGTSPRYGWLTKQGKALRNFILEASRDMLLGQISEDSTPCYPDYCNCDGDECENPFWKSSRPTTAPRLPLRKGRTTEG